jgi:hypothetical protein
MSSAETGKTPAARNLAELVARASELARRPDELQRWLLALRWGELAPLSVSPVVPVAVRTRADGQLRDRLPGMRLGDRITLAKLASRRLLPVMLREKDARVLAAAMSNPRLGASELAAAIGAEQAPGELPEVVDRSRWREEYRVRLALVRQPRTPIATALSHMTALNDSDLHSLVAAPPRPLLALVARRILVTRGH